MEDIEEGGKSVEEAVAKALSRLGLDRSQVEVEVIKEGRASMFGLGGEEALVRVRPLSAATAGDQESGAVSGAREVLFNLLAMMGFDASVTSRLPDTAGDGAGRIGAVLDVTGVDPGLLIGRRGTTLAALQFLVNTIINRRQLGKPLLVAIDVEGYKRKREEALMKLAQRLGEQVRANKGSVALEPMPPSERRIVHLALAEEPDITTSSTGEGEARRVVISYKG